MALSEPGIYKDGEIVKCCRCAKAVRVKYFDRDTVVVVSTQEQQTLALRCQYCGYVMCDSCAHPPERIFPVCPNCQRDWGPYYFLRDFSVIEIGSVKKSDDTNVKNLFPATEAVLMSQQPFLQSEFLGSGEIDAKEQNSIEGRWGRLKGFFFIIPIIFLFLVILFALVSPRMSKFREGLELLSIQPEKTSALSIAETITLPKDTPAQKASSTFVGLSYDVNLNSTRISYNKIITTPEIIVTGTPFDTVPPIQLILSTLTPNPFTSTPIFTPTTDSLLTSTPTESITDKYLEGCLPALSVSLNDFGKNICVYGTVAYTTTQNAAFSIYFSSDDGTFRIIIYDRVPKNIKIGDCVKVVGDITSLADRPVMALRYHDIVEGCSP